VAAERWSVMVLLGVRSGAGTRRDAGPTGSDPGQAAGAAGLGPAAQLLPAASTAGAGEEGRSSQVLTIGGGVPALGGVAVDRFAVTGLTEGAAPGAGR